MSTPAAKRRRIEAASTLQKPFRSPFKTPFKSPLIKGSPNTRASTAAAAVTTPLSSKTPTSYPVVSIPSPKTAIRTKKSFTSPISAAVINADPDIAPLLKDQRELEKLLKEVKEELDTAEQAKKIERDSKAKDKNGSGEIDGELVDLCEKWRSASRLAAEELFGKVRDRVNRMGGPRAWKEMQKRQHEYQNNWDQDEANNNNNNNFEDEDEEGKDNDRRDVYAEYSIDPETENEKAQRAPGLGDTGENPGEEDEFTMAMMLRTLNVDLAVIGYDREQQRWND
ncbi:putative dna repair protein dds20 protein [Botrytis fragariae]|uniref:Putative dna repair protein dds20 protein n=1 Tax=Botrytis fragariae TaxID=1964551 RepID=A0A8H6EE86_9HELO|nr:putative dna repair protein dds20 protein [Botrytis fragariae]KAF5868966.1 putative dna repair protein dds20 protein [Botrytis fragariae]